MANRLRARPASPDRRTIAGGRSAEWLERTAAALAIALAVARPLFPSEDAAEGSGLVFVGLWGFAALLWTCAQAARGELRFYVQAADGLALVLLATVIVSVLGAGTPRPAINMASEWGGLVLAYFVTRQVFRDAAARRTLIAAMLALAASLSIDGIYQAFWGLEPLRSSYLENPGPILADLGIAPDSPQQQTFENRLRSHEPFATFALANSLAGYLVAWLPLMLGWLAGRYLHPAPAALVKSSPSSPWPRVVRRVTWLVGTASVLVTIACLILTQSRTAYVALVVEFGLVALCFGSRLVGEIRRQVSTKLLVAGLGAIALSIVALVVLAVARGKMDEKLITQAAKSMNFRWQYWRATAALVGDFPWTGTGPGNFGGHYLAYKLAESSEEVSDPHNMVLEIAATSGVPAAAAFLCFLGLSAWRLVRGPEPPERPVTPDALWKLLAPGLCGWALGALFSTSDATPLFVLFLIWAGLAAVFLYGASGELDRPRVIVVAVFGLAIHLLGAGGICMPAVAECLWLLVALGMNASESDRQPRVNRSPKLTGWLLVGIAAGLLVFGMEVLSPVTSSQTALARGRRLFLDGDRAGAEGQVRAAILYDPLSAEPWMELSRIQYQRWAGHRGALAEELYLDAVKALETATDLAPSRVEPQRMLAELLEARARRDEHKGYWVYASQAYEDAVKMYPASARLRARLAEALWQADRRDAAWIEMREALRLDAATPHVEKKLDATDREEFERRVERAVEP